MDSETVAQLRFIANEKSIADLQKQADILKSKIEEEVKFLTAHLEALNLGYHDCSERLRALEIKPTLPPETIVIKSLLHPKWKWW